MSKIRQGWIYTKYRQPEFDQVILGWLAPEKEVVKARYEEAADGTGYFDTAQFEDSPLITKDQITHWMPLPDPPDNVS